ncbi:ABC transporter permease [Metabacillus niabensis]|uniref:Simple sugar transport system permease protein n=1 Tax=Metabacillus niabensis TaxID=324854 RepID=A0ABT9Z7W3_9BACI|nr:ABC transporter permease [Metabacillus niabensis]MDQ0228353.1 simple sugar transport system permease protein [Metabacillus niabensis]PAD67148.1 ABC transporter permease [Bacillus sp. 7586-K]
MSKRNDTQKEKFIQKVGRVLAWPISHEKWQSISIPLYSILLSFIAAAIVILLIGKNPLQAFFNLLQGAGIMPKPSYAAYKSMFTDFLSLLNAMTPLVFASLAVAVAFKAGLFNIGVSGQMLFSGFLATIIVGYSGLDAMIAKPLVLIIGIAAGALMGGLVGWLKYKFNINEVVSTIMLNYITQYVVSFFIQMYYIDPVSRQSRYITEESRLTLVNVEMGNLKMDIPLGFILAIIVAILLKFVMDKTVLGYEIKTVGTNRNAAKYAGMNVGKNTVLAMVLSGGLAGLAGVTYYLGYFASIQPKVLSSIGFDSIAVSLLGNSNPIGVIFSSFLISVINQGNTYMSSMAGIRQEIASVIVGLILLFSACGAYLKYKVSRMKEKDAERKEGQE